ncbi:hypothetical protein GOBAR_AA15109 [Gossypium barbadense]|uniref:Uncharacterized protein n=1 Tax=Gossypium barbadense TaxID=3634 RepID=A0A2P5XQB6_GOSBA|nr:hypothetical protein GOBAR_AA15109 [Gossypium barbadense]
MIRDGVQFYLGLNLVWAVAKHPKIRYCTGLVLYTARNSQRPARHGTSMPSQLPHPSFSFTCLRPMHCGAPGGAETLTEVPTRPDNPEPASQGASRALPAGPSLRGGGRLHLSTAIVTAHGTPRPPPPPERVSWGMGVWSARRGMLIAPRCPLFHLPSPFETPRIAAVAHRSAPAHAPWPAVSRYSGLGGVRQCRSRLTPAAPPPSDIIAWTSLAECSSSTRPSRSGMP